MGITDDNINLSQLHVDDNINLSIHDLSPGEGGRHTSISLTGMLVLEQISSTQNSRMTPNSNPQKMECPKIQTQKNRMTQDAMSKFE